MTNNFNSFIADMINRMKSSSNPQGFVMNMIGSNPNVQNNELMQNAISMAQKGDVTGLEKMARNMAKERGIDINRYIGMFK